MRKEEKKGSAEPKKSLPERMLGRGSARVTFAVGVLLTFPGVSYLTALDRMAKLDAGDAATVAARRRLLPDPAAPARGAAARLRVRPGAHRARRDRLSRVARPQRAPRGDDRRRGARRPAARPRPDRADRLGARLRPARKPSGSSITVLRSSPIPSISTRTVSPAFMKPDGNGCTVEPTPAGRAGGDHVAGLEREGFREVGDLLEAVEDHLARCCRPGAARR